MISTQEIEKRYGVEIEVLKRLGMRWAVLTSLYHTLSKKGLKMPSTVNWDLRIARIKIESGCFNVCEVSCELDKAEPSLIQTLTSSRKEEDLESFDYWLNLLGKAMRAELEPEEVRGLPFIRPVIQNCEFLKCACGVP